MPPSCPPPADPEDPPPAPAFGWRCAIHVTLTPEQARLAWINPYGPCAQCSTSHLRYGPGGQPLCAACRPIRAPRKDTAVPVRTASTSQHPTARKEG